MSSPELPPIRTNMRHSPQSIGTSQPEVASLTPNVMPRYHPYPSYGTGHWLDPRLSGECALPQKQALHEKHDHK